jgi:very-short-patch-repair endonuclease
MKLNNNFKPPPPTKPELKLRNILRSKKIPFKESQVIWYTGCDNYTPDLIIGRNLIIEVDGKIHDQEFRKTPDRIRERALRNMGYDVFRVKNEQIQKKPDAVAERIIQKYFEAADAEDNDDKTIKITKIERPFDYNPVSREIVDNIEVWAALLNKELNSDDCQRWTAEYFKEALGQFHPKLVTNQCAIERLMLLLNGLNLRKKQDGILDFKYSLNLLENAIDVLNGLFSVGSSNSKEGSIADIHLKNMYNITAPGFFKNLIFKGGPNINPGIASIRDKATLEAHIDIFNKSFSKIGITVEPSEIKVECNSVLRKLRDKDEISKYKWLSEWMNV